MGVGCPYWRGVGIRMVAKLRWAWQFISGGSIYRLPMGRKKVIPRSAGRLSLAKSPFSSTAPQTLEDDQMTRRICRVVVGDSVQDSAGVIAAVPEDGGLVWLAIRRQK